MNYEIKNNYFLNFIKYLFYFIFQNEITHTQSAYVQ